VCVVCLCVCVTYVFLCGQFDQAHVCAVSRVHFVSRPVSRCIPCAEQGVLYERVVMLLTERANHPPLCGLVCSLAPSGQLANLKGACQKSHHDVVRLSRSTFYLALEEKILPVHVSYRKPRDVGVGVQSLAAAAYAWLSKQMMLCILAALMPGF
jgi:hypothetical protein